MYLSRVACSRIDPGLSPRFGRPGCFMKISRIILIDLVKSRSLKRRLRMETERDVLRRAEKGQVKEFNRAHVGENHHPSFNLLVMINNSRCDFQRSLHYSRAFFCFIWNSMTKASHSWTAIAISQFWDGNLYTGAWGYTDHLSQLFSESPSWAIFGTSHKLWIDWTGYIAPTFQLKQCGSRIFRTSSPTRWFFL